MPRAFVVRAAVGDGSIDHPTTRLENTPEYDGAGELALAGRMLGDAPLGCGELSALM
jgi:hypothetical protein